MHVYQFLSFVCIIDTLSGFYLEKYFGGGGGGGGGGSILQCNEYKLITEVHMV